MLTFRDTHVLHTVWKLTCKILTSLFNILLKQWQYWADMNNMPKWLPNKLHMKILGVVRYVVAKITVIILINKLSAWQGHLKPTRPLFCSFELIIISFHGGWPGCIKWLSWLAKEVAHSSKQWILRKMCSSFWKAVSKVSLGGTFDWNVGHRNILYNQGGWLLL